MRYILSAPIILGIVFLGNRCCLRSRLFCVLQIRRRHAKVAKPHRVERLGQDHDYYRVALHLYHRLIYTACSTARVSTPPGCQCTHLGCLFKLLCDQGLLTHRTWPLRSFPSLPACLRLHRHRCFELLWDYYHLPDLDARHFDAPAAGLACYNRLDMLVDLFPFGQYYICPETPTSRCCFSVLSEPLAGFYFVEIFYVQYRVSGTLFDYLVAQDCVY
jgi:hypothetical protein